MEIKHAIFPAPKNCPQSLLQRLFKTAGERFIVEMERRGCVLKSSLDFYMDAAASNQDPNDNQYIIRGWFQPSFPEQPWVLEVPEATASKIAPKLKKYGGKVRIDN